MTPFAQMLAGSDLLGAYGDADTAVLVYNPHTTLVADTPAPSGSPSATAGSSTTC